MKDSLYWGSGWLPAKNYENFELILDWKTEGEAAMGIRSIPQIALGGKNSGALTGNMLHISYSRRLITRTTTKHFIPPVRKAIMPITPKPVSYTHLDVYKRQNHSRL